MPRLDRACAFNTIVTGGFAAFFLYLWLSGRALDFIHPRMLLFTKLAALALTILTLVQTRRLFAACGGEARTASFLLLIPLALAAMLTPGTLDASIAGRKGVSLGGTERSVSPAKPSSAPQQGRASQDDAATQGYQPADALGDEAGQLKNGGAGPSSPQGEDAPGPSGEAAARPGPGGERIVFRDETFLSQLDAIYGGLVAMGREVELIGFVYQQEDFAPGEFVVSRYAISCCAADAQVVGLLCLNATGRPVQKDAWVRVRGMIEESIFDGQPCPRIRVNDWTAVTAPKNAYVY